MKLAKSALTPPVAAITALFALSVMADVITVGSSGADYTTVSDALKNAKDGDEILLAPEEFTVTATIAVTAGVTIRGTGKGPEDTVLRGNGSVRVLELSHADALVKNLTLADGHVVSGKALGGNVCISGDGGTVEDCIITGGTSGDLWNCGGFGAYVNSDDGVIRNCIFEGNCSDEKSFTTKGGVALYLAKGLVEDSLFRGNFYHRQSMFVNNHSKENHGTVRVDGGTLRCCTIVDNENVHGGSAGVYASGGSVTGCVIVCNRAGRGAEACVWEGSADKFTDCVSDRALINANCVQAPLQVRDEPAGDFSLVPCAELVGRGYGAIGTDEPAVGFYYAQAGELSVAFTAKLVNLSADTPCAWDFGDGTTSSESNPVHAFAETGVYDVSLTAAGKTYVRNVYVKGSVIYLDPASANPSAPYATPETAARTYAEAESVAADGDRIMLPASDVQRTFADAALVFKAVTVSGGTDDPEETRVTSSANMPTFVLANPGSKVIGLAISGTNGKNPCGAGVFAHYAGGMVSNCIFRSCRATISSNGGAILLMGPSLVTHCTITNNYMTDEWPSATSGGVGVGIRSDAAHVENCLIAQNATKLTVNGADSDKQPQAAGVCITAGSLVNCTIAGNRSRYCGGVHATGGSILNCVIDGNTSEGVNGQAQYRTYCGSASLFTACASDDVRINDTCFSGHSALSSDFRPTASSTDLIDKGVMPPDGVAAKDLAGNPRVSRSGIIDIGCYEFPDGAFSVSYAITPGIWVAPCRIAFTATTRGESGAVTYAWDFGDGQTEETDKAEVEHLYPAGTFTVGLTARDASGAQATVGEPATIRVSPRTLHVADGNEAAAAPYDTWANAAASIEDVAEWMQDGTEVVLSNGTYLLSQTFSIASATTVRSLTGRPEDVEISAHGKEMIAVAVNHPQAVLSSVSVTGAGHVKGETIGGNGVRINGQGGTVTNCIMRGNDSGLGMGCGVGIYSDNGLVTHCIITNNVCWDQWGGSGLGAWVQKGRLSNSLVAFNCHNQDYRDQPTDRSSTKGAVYVSGGTVENCTIVSNAAGYVAGVWADGGTVRNCLIAGNWSKAATPETRDERSVWGGTASCFTHCVADRVRINDACRAGDPAFVDFDGGDFRIRVNSAAYGAGEDPADMPRGDLDGNPRKVGRRVDAGCYECQQTYGLMLLVK